MTFTLGSKSLACLEGVHPDLVRVVKRAILITAQDFSVTDGVRTRAQQARHVASGASKTMASLHLIQPDGFGHAVDLVPCAGGRPVWDWTLIWPVTLAMRQAAIETDLPLIWGGIWDRRLADLPGNRPGLVSAVDAYKARRRATGKSAFLDGPHYEIA